MPGTEPIEMWIATGLNDPARGASVRVFPYGNEEAKGITAWRGAIAAVYKITRARNGHVIDETSEYVGYLTLQEIKRLASVMEGMTGPADAPLPPPISGPEFESYKIVEGPNV